MPKLGAGEWDVRTPVRYPNVYAVERTTGPERLIIGPTADHVEVLLSLAEVWQQDYYLLYVLLVPRQATAPVTVAGVAVPEGSNVSVNIFLIQRNARFWPQPDAFRPERWGEGGRTPEAFMPFGAGARMCIGNHLALMEAGLIAALVLRDFDLEVPGGGPTGLVAGVTLKPDGAVRGRVEWTSAAGR